MKIYYRVKKETPMWEVGAIIARDSESKKYLSIEDLWNRVEGIPEYWESSSIIESEKNKDYFERVYPDTLQGNLYRTKDQMVALYKDAFKQ